MVKYISFASGLMQKITEVKKDQFVQQIIRFGIRKKMSDHNNALNFELTKELCYS